MQLTEKQAYYERSGKRHETIEVSRQPLFLLFTVITERLKSFSNVRLAKEKHFC